MLKKLILGSLLLAGVAIGTLYFWANTILSTDVVRAAVEHQLSRALGEPVRIGRMGITVLPRVTMALKDVRIGEPERASAETLYIGTDLRALVSRRIEHASLRLDRATVRLPLPLPTQAPASTGAGDASKPPVEIVSVDEISLTNVEVVSGGRTLRGSIELSATGSGLLVKDVTLGTGDTSIHVTGAIADAAGPVGDLTVHAAGLNVLELFAFLSDFSTGVSPPTGITSASGTGQATPSTMNLAVTLAADRALFGSLAADHISGKGRITSSAATIDPARFTVFGGRYDGTLQVTLNDDHAFTLRASVTGIDMGAVTQFAGRPGSMTGTLAGRLDITGRGTSASDVLSSARGHARVAVADGTIKGLGLVRGIVLATSTRADSRAEVRNATADEPFSTIETTLAMADGMASTDDFRFESKDLSLTGGGQFRLDGTRINLASRVQLSEALSKQAGRDLVRYTQADGRVTIPVTVTGGLGDVHVRLDVGDLAKRAITNRASEEAKDAIRKGLGDLVGR